MAQAFFGAIVIAGPAIGPTLGGYLVTNVDWRWIFFVNLPLGILAIFMVIAVLPRPEGGARAVDWTAIALLAVGLGGLQTFLEEGHGEGWFESGFILLPPRGRRGGLVLLRRARAPSARPRRRPPRAALPLPRGRQHPLGGRRHGPLRRALRRAHLRAGHPLRSQQTGMMLLPGALASASMPIAARLMRRFDPRMLLVCGALILVVAALWLANLTPQTARRTSSGRSSSALRPDAHVPAAQHGDARTDPEGGHRRGDRLLQPHPAARRQRRRRAAEHAAQLARGIPPLRAARAPLRHLPAGPVPPRRDRRRHGRPRREPGRRAAASAHPARPHREPPELR